MGIVWSYAVAGWPFVLPNVMFLLRRRRSHYIGWFRKQFASLRQITFSRYSHYRNALEEERYWQATHQTWEILDRSNDRHVPKDIPIVHYYTPKLLPLYRTKVRSDLEAEEYALSARTFCKWHRMVFPGPRHPTLMEAEKQIEYFSSRDRREMRRMTKLVTDEAIFNGSMPWTPRYRDMWRTWLQQKGPDVAIVFV